jgi:hypothetical protein
VCRGPKKHRLAVEEQGGVALLHPADQLVRDIVDGPRVAVSRATVYRVLERARATA